MEIQSPSEIRFRERVLAERKHRGWSQSGLAKMLQDKGLDQVHPTTIAKIESGDRAVRINEANALADLFEVSVDALLGRTVPKNDVRHTARALTDALVQASWQIESIERALRERTSELAVFQPKGWMKGFQSTSEIVCDKVADASAAIQEALNPPYTTEVKRLSRQLLRDELDEEERADGTQS